MNVRIITYNMGMGVSDRSSKPIIESRDDAFEVFADQFAQAYKSDGCAAWFICVQEIFRNYHGNQVEELQDRLRDKTGVSWYKNSTTHENSTNSNAEAVAVFSTIDREKEQKWILKASKRAAQAYKAKIASGKYLWVVTTHLIKTESDTEGKLRKADIQEILDKMATFDVTVPIVLCGDMNIIDTTPGTSSVTPDPHLYPELFDETIGKVTDAGFTRGASFSPTAADITIHAWNNPPQSSMGGDWYILDYILVNERGKCTAEKPTILNYTSGGDFASDHKGLQMKIPYP